MPEFLKVQFIKSELIFLFLFLAEHVKLSEIRISSVTRKYDTLIHLPSCGGRKPAADYGSKQESVDNSNKQNWQWERPSLSPTLSIITRRYGHGSTSLSISHLCVSGEAEPSTMIGTEEEPAKKNQHVVNFQTMKTKWVAVHSLQGEDA